MCDTAAETSQSRERDIRLQKTGEELDVAKRVIARSQPYAADKKEWSVNTCSECVILRRLVGLMLRGEVG